MALGILQFIGVFAYSTLNEKCKNAAEEIAKLNEKIDQNDKDIRREIKDQNQQILNALANIQGCIKNIELDLAKNYVDYETFTRVLNEFPCHSKGHFEANFDCTKV
jgi:DNA-binding transcriptional regulator GbsR (MarR family)